MSTTVFLSSTIKDLADLRSAVKFWLEENGFEVFASEWPDFPHRLDRPAVEAALAPIGDCDYYILIIGTRAGTIVEDTGLSVTRTEFRRARELRRRSGRPQMLHLVRSEVASMSRVGSPGTSTDETDRAVLAFLDEVATEERPGDPNWLRSFSTFREAVDAIRATLRISGPLRRRALEANLVREIASNTQELLLRTTDGRTVPKFAWLTQDHVAVPPRVGDSIDVGYPGTRRIFEFYISLPRTASLSRSALEQAVTSGEFLEYDPRTGTFGVGPIQECLLNLKHQLLRVEDLAGPMRGHEQIARDFALATEAAKSKRGARISEFTALFLHSTRNALENVIRLNTSLYRVFTQSGITPTVPELLPAAPRAKPDDFREDPTLEEAQAWLRS